MKEVLVSVIIVNWNGLKFLDGCLSSLYEQSIRDFEIILVDNGSDDGSIDFMQSRFPGVSVIPQRVNTGFAYGNNVGIMASKGKYIFTLNNDTRVEKDCLGYLLTEAEKSPEEMGMWAPKILSFQDPGVIDSVGGLLLYPDGIGKGRGRLEEDKGQYDGLKEILFPSGCAALYRKRMLNEVGYFDEDFFAYCEDTDLGLRANLAGWKGWSVPRAVVYHHYSATGGAYSARKAYLVERNRLWVAIKNYPLGLLAKVPFYSFRRYACQIHGILSGRGAGAKFVRDFSTLDLIRIFIRAQKDGIKGGRRMFHKRREIQKLKRIPDRDIINRIYANSLSAFGIAMQE